MMESGWIKIHRKILDWEWSDSPEMIAVWVHILLNASHEPKQWHNITIERGQLVITRESFAEQVGISEQTLRTCLARLINDQQIVKKTTNKFTILTVCNYDKYQVSENTNQPTNNQQLNQQKKEKSPTTSKEKEQEEKNINTPPIVPPLGAEVYGKFKNVFLKPVEKRQLDMNFGQATVDECIEDFSCKLADGGVESANHYATLTYWLAYRKKHGTLPKSAKDRDTIGVNFTSD